jgi:hypothetical protein
LLGAPAIASASGSSELDERFRAERLDPGEALGELVLRLSRQAVQGAAERLMDRGHVARDDGPTRVVDPLLVEWLRRR